jgi:hypothetical protein
MKDYVRGHAWCKFRRARVRHAVAVCVFVSLTHIPHIERHMCRERRVRRWMADRSL